MLIDFNGNSLEGMDMAVETVHGIEGQKAHSRTSCWPATAPRPR